MAKEVKRNCNVMVRASGMNINPDSLCGKCPACLAKKKADKKAKREWERRHKG